MKPMSTRPAIMEFANRPILFVSAFAAYTLALLLGVLSPYLVETAALTPFYTNAPISEILGSPCGLLLYVASGCQRCMVYPWLGASLFTALLIAMAFVLRWAFRVSDAWFGLCWIPSFALLVNYTQLGYLIYTVKHPAIAFAEPLGLLIAFCLIGLWYRLNDWRWKVAFMLLVPTVGFWLFGFFGLVVLPFLGFCELAIARFLLSNQPTGKKSWPQFLWGLSLFLAGFLLPVILRAVLQLQIDIEMGHVSFTNDQRDMRNPWFIAYLFPTAFACFRFVGKKFWMTIVAAVVFVALAIAAYTYSFRDPNFLNTLKMKHAAEAGKWEQVLQLANENQKEPTRAQVCLTRLALFKTGRMGDELFTYPEGSAAYNAPQQNQWLRLMIGPLLYYHYGKLGFAYRWAMEDLVEYGERPAYLRYLLNVACLNGEEALAHRYERALTRTLFNDDVQKEVEKEVNAIRPLLNFNDQLDGDNGLVEFYLLNSFSLSQGGSREMVELSLMNSLITKNLTGFWHRFMALLPTWQGRIPTHYQEAALMVAQLQGASPVPDLPVDPTIQQRFQRLIDASARRGDNAANAIALRPEFGNTYWYYYFFVEGLKTN
ncbi:MAG: hypothetical protein J6W75_03935 [Bacteroidaceae bacterium]|nr:hypothetical protein [Bacteroidaceae bacterium]